MQHLNVLHASAVSPTTPDTKPTGTVSTSRALLPHDEGMQFTFTRHKAPLRIRDAVKYLDN